MDSDLGKLGTEMILADCLRAAALRWLHSLDLNEVSPTRGVADREYWAWKTKDFPNGTWQAGLLGLLDSAPCVNLSDQQLERVVEAVILGARTIQRRDGSFEEAYPYESSFAVTGLVQFSFLSSFFRYERLFSSVARNDLQELVARTDRFLRRQRETHGLISNHLTTSWLASAMAARLVPNAISEKKDWVGMVAKLQDDEGWFPEYGGADPGYQTLLNHYLCAALESGIEDPRLRSALKKSHAFIEAFAFSDGTFGGEVGSRGTTIFYPSGAPARLGRWTEERYFPHVSAVTPLVVDQGNFVPVFNSWALYYRLSSAALKRATVDQSAASIDFERAGLLVRKTAQCELAVSLRNGAIVRIERDGENAGWRDGSCVALTRGTQSTQLGMAVVRERSDRRVIYSPGVGDLKQELNSPFRSVLIRAVSVSLSPFPPLQRLFKLALAKFVMNGCEGRQVDSGIEIQIELASERLDVKVSGAEGWQRRRYGFHSHMASANAFSERAL